MPHNVRVNVANTTLPDGLTYNATQVVTLSDTDFSHINPLSLTDGTLTDLGAAATQGAAILGGPINVVAFSTTPTYDLSLGVIQKITLTASVTASTFTNPSVGERVTFFIVQGGAGSFTHAWPANVRFAAATAPTLTTTAGHSDSISVVYDGSQYLVTSIVQNYTAV